MATETDSSHLPQSSSSSYLPPPQPRNPVNHLSSSDSSIQGLQNEGMTNNGFQIPSSDDFYSCIVFNINELKNILLSCFDPHEPDNIAREELSEAEATTDSNDHPQHRGSDLYETWPSHVYQSIPCCEQTQKDDSSEQVLSPQSLSPFPPRQTDGGFEASTKNFRQCEMWNGLQGNNNQEDQIHYATEGSAYMISRRPFDPIGRPFNPFGPIERPIPRLPSSYDLADLGFV